MNIDVHVTNRRGRPVAGLTAADFEVFEDGRPVEITNFLDATSGAGEWVDGDEAGGLEEFEAPLLVALYIDRHRTSQASLRRIQDDLAAFLEARNDPDSNVRFLLATGEPELRIRTPFTTDPRDLIGALQALGNEAPASVEDDETLRRRALSEIRNAYETCVQPSSTSRAPGCIPCIDVWPSMVGSATQYAARVQSRAGTSLSTLAELTTALGGLPGPKALVHVSEGMPQRPGAELFHHLGQICVDRQSETYALEREWDDTSRFNRFSSLSNANRVTIYSVDAGGVRASSAADVTFAGSLSESGDFAGSGNAQLASVLRPSGENDRLRVDNLQATLNLLASETGGRAIFNHSNPARALEDIASDFGTYYSLGYRAPDDRNRPIRQVDVRLAGKKQGSLRVRFRRSYILKSDDRRLADRLFAALRLGEQTNPLGIEIGFGQVSVAEEAEQPSLPVEVTVPTTAVTTLPGPAGAAGAVRIFLVAEDQDGRRTPMRQKTLTMTEAVMQAAAASTVVVNVPLPPGNFTVAVGVRDEATGRGSYVVRDVLVTDPEGRAEG